MKLTDYINNNTAYSGLRVIMGLIFISHGIARFYYNSIPDFGGFLNANGFVVGIVLAWMITIGEVVSGSLLTLGHYVKKCVIFHAVIILVGLFLIHIPNGWFVVGHGTGGAEYSLLILAVLINLYHLE